MTAFTPVEALDRIPLPEIDNPLPRLLKDHAALAAVALDKSIETLMDVDTPTDLAVLSLYPRLPESLRPALVTTELQRSQLKKAIACFTNKDARVTVAGRVGSFVWSRMETDTACRCRVVSEGRGMRADGWGGGGKSMLGYLLDSSGVSGFFDKLSEMGDAAFLDTRVIFNHAGKNFLGGGQVLFGYAGTGANSRPVAAGVHARGKGSGDSGGFGRAFAGVGGDAGAYRCGLGGRPAGRPLRREGRTAIFIDSPD